MSSQDTRTPTRHVELNQDVLHVICQIIRNSKEGRSSIGNSYRDRLKNCALSFRAISEPALDALWHTLPSLIPLFALHPSVTLQDNQCVIQPTSEIVWRKFDQYAIRVRCLTSLERDPLDRQITPYVGEYLSRLRPGHALLPALKEIHLPKINENFDGQTLLPVISNNLDTLEINAVHNKRFVTTLLCCVGQFSPSIRVLKARHVGRSAHILSAINCFHSLQTLDLENEYLDWPWFANFYLHLPKLEHLSLGLSDSPESRDLALKRPSSQERLKLISLRVSGPGIASHILNYVDRGTLKVLAIKETQSSFAAESASELVNQINQLLFLSRLTLEIRDGRLGSGLQMDILQSLIELKCGDTLEELNLSSNAFITELSNDSITRLAYHLPVVKRLSLPTKCSQEVYPTLELLLLLGRDAPTLQELRIPLQDLELPPNYKDFCFSHGSLKKLSVCLVSICLGDYKPGFWGMAQTLANQVTPQLVEMLKQRFPSITKMEPYDTNVYATRTTQNIFNKIVGSFD